MFYFGHDLIAIYVQPGPEQEAVIQAGLIRMGHVGRLYALCGIMDTMVGSLRGLGCSVVPMLGSLVGSCLLRLVWVYTIFPRNPTPETLFLSYPVTWIVTAVFQIGVYLFIRKSIFEKV